MIDWATSVIDAIGLAGVALLIALESVVPPIPSEAVLLLTGFNVDTHRFSLVPAVLAATAGSVVGAWVLYGLGSENRNLPGFIAMCPGGYPIKDVSNWQSGFLPGNYQGTFVDSQHREVAKLLENIRSPHASTVTQRRQLDLLREINSAWAGDDPRLDARIQSFELAFNMQTEATDAFDISGEPEHIREAYGDHVQGRLFCVFGCGGDRDTGKRPQMAAIAERLADVVVVTDDNPRTEDGDVIVADIMAGFAKPAAVLVQRDRAQAIAQAVAQAGPDDIVLVAGKGHEPYQEIHGVKHPFDDTAVARHALEDRR